MTRKTSRFHKEAKRSFVRAMLRLKKLGREIESYPLFYLGYVSGYNKRRREERTKWGLRK